MRTTGKGLVTVLVGLVLALGAAAPAVAKSYRADRFDARIRLLPGGDLEVVETVVFRFETGTFDHVFREIPSRHTDGIEIVSASMDGRAFPIGEGVNHLEVKRGSRTRVQWRFQPAAESAHTFVLSYIARGVVQQGDTVDLLAWRALPTEHQYRIGSSTVEFELPAAVTVAGSRPVPRMEWHRIDGAVDSGPRQAEQDGAAPVVLRATAQDIRSNGWIEAAIDLPKNSVLTSPPAWQRTAIEARAFAPRLATAAALIVATGLVILFGMRQQYDPPRRDALTASLAITPPDSLSPALVGALLANGTTALEHAMASLFSLAAAGVISIDEQARGRFGQHNFLLRRRRTPPALAPHENALLALTFDDGRENEGATLPAIRRRLSRGFRNFSNAVREDLFAAGLLNLDRKRVRDRYTRLGVALLVFGACAFLAAALFAGRYGGWTFLIPSAFVVVAVASLIFASSTTPLSDEGVMRAARWRSFRGYLKSLSQDHESTPPGNLDLLLPFAVASGLAYSWARFLKRHPGSVPAWFHALSPTSQDSSFTAFMASGGAHGGGAGATGAAGGGASGAG